MTFQRNFSTPAQEAGCHVVSRIEITLLTSGAAVEHLVTNSAGYRSDVGGEPQATLHVTDTDSLDSSHNLYALNRQRETRVRQTYR